MIRIQTRAALPVFAASLVLPLLLAGCGLRNPFSGGEEAPRGESARERPAQFSPAEPGEYAEDDRRVHRESFPQADAQPQIRSGMPGVPESRSNAYPPPPAVYADELGEGERMIFDPRVEGLPQPDAAPGIASGNVPIAFSPSRPMNAPFPKRSMFSPGSKPFAGASVGRSNAASVRSMEAKQRAQSAKQPAQVLSGKERPDERNMLASAPAPRNPSAPSFELNRDEDMRLDQEVRAKAAAARAASNTRQLSAMAAPAGADRYSLPKTEVAAPAPKPAPQATPAPAPVPQDEIFTPDLFLS